MLVGTDHLSVALIFNVTLVLLARLVVRRNSAAQGSGPWAGGGLGRHSRVSCFVGFSLGFPRFSFGFPGFSLGFGA